MVSSMVKWSATVAVLVTIVASISADAESDILLQRRLTDITSKADLSVSKESGNGTNSPEGSLKLTDGQVITKFFLGGYSQDFWAKLSFPKGEIVREYSLASANDHADRNPRSWILAASKDDSKYVILDQRTNEIFTSRWQTKTYSVINTTGYKHYKLLVTANNGAPDLAIAEFRVSQ